MKAKGRLHEEKRDWGEKEDGGLIIVFIRLLRTS